VKRIISYPSTTPNTMVNTFKLPNLKLHLFTGPELLKKLRLAATALGPDILGFTADQLGLHSVRSGTAMAMFLAGVPVFQIMLLGWWASDAFLQYIRKQVKEFSSGISQKMITQENFFTIPSADMDQTNNKGTCLPYASKNNIGFNFSNTVIPLVSVFC
jgi:hypothetical protein